MYSKCGSMKDAQKVFDSVPGEQVDIVLWNALMLGYAENGNGERALEMFASLLNISSDLLRFLPGSRTYVAALKACSTLAVQEEEDMIDNFNSTVKWRSLEKGMAVHAQAASASENCCCSADIFLGNALIDMYCKSGSVADARKIFDGMQRRDIVSWNALISGYVHNGDSETALELYSTLMMQESSEGSVQVSAMTSVAALKACSSLAIAAANEEKIQEVLEKGMALHSQASGNGFDSNSFLISSLVEMYSKCGSLVDARMVFDRIPVQNLVTWNVMLSACVDNGEPEEALELFQVMPGYCFPDGRSYVAAFKACTALASAEESKRLEDGKFAKLLSLETGMALHSQVVKTGHFDRYVECSLVDLYSKCGALQEARRVFEGMKKRDAVSLNSLLLGFVENGEGDEALRVLHDQIHLIDDGSFDQGCLVAAVKACGSSAALQLGKDLHRRLCRRGIDCEATVLSCLVEFYGKCGSMTEAQLVFDRFAGLSSDQALTWTALIAGYSRQGNCVSALGIFEEMVAKDLEPNGVTFLRILTVCSHGGLVEEGKKYFGEMQEKFGMRGEAEHYQCMIDLLARGNRLEEAVAMVEAMPCKASVMNWLTVLGGCNKWKNLRVARRAFDEIMLLDEKQEAAYVLMAGIVTQGCCC